MHPLVVRPRRLVEMDLESSEDRRMILVLIAISPSSLMFFNHSRYCFWLPDFFF